MNKKPMKVCHLASFFESNQLYGRLTEALVDLGVDQTVFSPRGFSNSNTDNPGIDYNGYNVWDKLDKVLFFRKQRKYRELLLQHASIGAFDLYHAHSLYSDGTAAHWLHQKFNVPYILTIRHSDLAYFSKYGVHLRALARRVLRDSSHIIFVNPNYRERLMSLLNVQIDAKKTSVVPNGLDPFWLETSFLHQANTENSVKILSVAEVKKDKNQKTIVKAVSEFNRTRTSTQPVLKLSIAGKCESAYGRRLRQRYQSDDITFTGKLPFTEIAQLMNESDLFALLSSPENFGIAYSEAVSQGLPIIYSKGEGFDGWEEEGIWGYACESSNQEQFIQRVLKIGKNNRLAPHAIDLLKKRFNWTVISKDVKHIYEQTLFS